MEKELSKKIIFISLIVLVFAFAGTVLGYLLVNEGILYSFLLIFVFSVLSLLTTYSIKFKDKKWLRLSARYSAFLLPFAEVYFLAFVYYTSNDLYWIVFTVICQIILFLALIHLFLFSDSKALTGTIIFMVLLIIGIYMKRNRYPFGLYTLSLSSEALAVGYFIYGIRSLFIAGKVPYLRNVAFYGSWIVTIAFLGQMFKLSHWPIAGWLLIIGFTFMIFGTLYVLLTLHTSGYIDWQDSYRKMMRRILLPWTLIFALYILRFMLPDVEQKIWSPEQKVTPYGFGMSDYEVKNKQVDDPE